MKQQRKVNSRFGSRSWSFSRIMSKAIPGQWSRSFSWSWSLGISQKSVWVYYRPWRHQRSTWRTSRSYLPDGTIPEFAHHAVPLILSSFSSKPSLKTLISNRKRKKSLKRKTK